MELHDLGQAVLENILCALHPEIVHRYRLVCKTWKSIIDKFEHIQSQLEAAVQQRYLYRSPETDANVLLILDRIFICETSWISGGRFQTIELLLDQNGTKCIRVISPVGYNTPEMAWSIAVEEDELTAKILFESADGSTRINHGLCTSVLEILGLEDFMTPIQFLNSLCKVAFNLANLEKMLQGENEEEGISLTYSKKWYEGRRSYYQHTQEMPVESGELKKKRMNQSSVSTHEGPKRGRKA